MWIEQIKDEKIRIWKRYIWMNELVLTLELGGLMETERYFLEWRKSGINIFINNK